MNCKALITILSMAAIIASGFDWAVQAQQPPLAPETDQPLEIAPGERGGAGRKEREIARIFRREIVVFGQDVTLKQNEVCRDMIVIGGNAIVEGTVQGDLVVILGSASVSGKVESGMVVVMGRAHLKNNAEVERDAVVVGGNLILEPNAALHGARREFAFGPNLPNLSWMADWFRQGFLLARPFPPLGWVWAVAATLFVVYLLMALVFARPLEACVTALESRPAGSFFAGVLTLILLGPLLFILVVSVAGILAVPVLVFAFLAALFFGKLAVYRMTGQQLGKQLNLAGLQSPVVALLIGIAIFYFFYTVPVLGFLIWGVATVWGLGAVLMAISASFSQERGPAPSETTTAAALAGLPLVPVSESEAPPVLAGAAEIITLRRAGFWIRLWATLLDLILLGAVGIVVGPFFLLIWIAYHVAMWTWKGTTIGGIVAGIKVVRTSGRPINFAIALVRSLSSFFSAAVFFLGFFWAGWNREKQAWHDKIAGTVVVRVPKGMSLV